MRITPLAAALVLCAGALPALAAPASVHVAVAPKLQKEAAKTYGVREVDDLAASLQRDVERSLARTGALQDARVELVLVDAKPNRPTFKQLSDKPGLSLLSHGIGGARIEGKIVNPDGSARDVAYSWYETDFRQTWGYSTWHDAEWTFDRFARRLGRGQDVASR